ncbi:hypothetical protein T4D_15874 [Trichinella pseudospiralis]|uniref:Uncharacterized protein n=1 Tax=Trichinella pseudospiralis TaxID=6337 RepID=A0A0V1F285_TRIPS|nr:hypothetical protein T4D_15874 [Trichinella pseudospiralis]
MPPRMKSICQLDVIMEATLDDYDWKTLDVVLGYNSKEITYVGNDAGAVEGQHLSTVALEIAG